MNRHAGSRRPGSGPAPRYRIPAQHNRTWLVTGATNGIGREVARAAAKAGARVLITARDRQRGRAVADELGDSAVIEVDLADLASVRAGAERLDEPVDVLINNAGVITPALRRSADGFELMLATNFLGPFAFTNLIVDRLRERVVIVGSGAHKGGRLDRADPHFHRRRFSPREGYRQSKLADMLWGLELGRRLRDRRLDVHLAHPGWAATNIVNSAGHPVIDSVARGVTGLFGQSSAHGAEPVLYAAVEDLPAGSYVGPDGRFEFTGHPTLVGRTRTAADVDLARWWWDRAVAETGTDLAPR